MEQMMSENLMLERAFLNILLKDKLIDDVEYADTLALILKEAEKENEERRLIS